MKVKNLIVLLILMTLLIFVTKINIANAQSLAQPRISNTTNINAATDRIMDMIQNDLEEEQAIKSDNDIQDTSSDIEIFSPPPKLTNTNEDTNLDSINQTISLKDDNSNSNKNIPSKKDNLYLKVLSSEQVSSEDKTKIITSVSGSNLKVETNKNGEIKNKISGADIAFVRELKTDSGKLIVGGLVDYNHDNYDSKVNGVTGKGDSDAITAGIIAKQLKNNGVYYEGSARIGRAKTDFNSDNFIINDQKTHVDYEESAPMYAGHVKVGKVIKIDEKNQTDIYGAYIFSHQDNNKIRLSKNETYNVGSIDSDRAKIGCRMTTKVKDGKVYYGLAYQYEGSAKVKITQKDTGATQTANAKGGSGVIELGCTFNVSQDDTFNVDLNATGFTGHQKGFTIQAQLIKSF